MGCASTLVCECDIPHNECIIIIIIMIMIIIKPLIILWMDPQTFRKLSSFLIQQEKNESEWSIDKIAYANNGNLNNE